MSKIRIVDYDLLEESGTEAPSSPTRLGREHWSALHDAMSEVLTHYGTVGTGEGVDFYHSGDWFDEHADAFTLMAGAQVSVRCLDDLHEALIRHDPVASLILEADARNRLFSIVVPQLHFNLLKPIDAGQE